MTRGGRILRGRCERVFWQTGALDRVAIGPKRLREAFTSRSLFGHNRSNLSGGDDFLPSHADPQLPAAGDFFPALKADACASPDYPTALGYLTE